MRASVRKVGNSSGVIIPKPLLVEVGAKVGDDVEVTVEDGRLIIATIKPKAREGWAEASQALVAVGEDGLVWPEFGNEDDDKLEW
jgi:antitoxin MazE